MALTKNGKRIGMAAHTEKREAHEYIEWKKYIARKDAEQAECVRELKIMQACERVFGGLSVQWYDSPAIPDRGYARDRIALIRAWAKEQVQIARAITPQIEENMDIIHELVKASEYADAPASYDQPDPHAVVESYMIDRQITDAWASIPEVEL